jgi:hypothetical protein
LPVLQELLEQAAAMANRAPPCCWSGGGIARIRPFEPSRDWPSPWSPDTARRGQELQMAVEKLLEEYGPGRRMDELLRKAEELGLNYDEKAELSLLLKAKGRPRAPFETRQAFVATEWPQSYTCRLRILNPSFTEASTLIKKAPAGTATQIADERQSQLKLLIARGKEQGYLTYAEVNDHLAERNRRSGTDRRHRQHDQRHGHSGLRKGAGCRVACC